MESSGKTITFPGRFLISVDVIAWKSNPWRPLWHGINRVPTTIARKDESPSEGPKNRFQGRKPARASTGDDDGRRRINSIGGRFRKLFSAVIADVRSNALIQCPTALPESGGRRGASVALRKSSDFQRLPSENLQSGNHGDSDDGKRQGASRLHTFNTFMRPYALRMQPYAVRMHFFGSSRKLGGSRAESTCEEPYALYAPLLGVGPFSALFLLRELHTVHTTAYG